MWQKDRQRTFFGDLFEKMISKDDLYRKIEDTIDFSFVNKLARPYYSELGAEGYPPSTLFKMLLVMYLENITSERALEEEVRFNLRYRYFLGFCDPLDKIPDHSTFSRFRDRLGDKLFKEIFEKLVSLCIEEGLAQAKHISVDSTSVLADVKIPEYRKEAEHPSESPTDSDATWGKKSAKRTFFGYKVHSAVDSHSGLILATEATSGSEVDHSQLKPLLSEIVSKHRVKVSYVAADKAYDTLKDRKYIREELSAQAVIPLRDTFPNKGYFPKQAFTFNSDGDLVCPEARRLKPLGYYKKQKIYVYRGGDCKSCKLKEKCTTSRKGRLIQFHQDELVRALDRQFNATAEFAKLYSLRNSAERSHADAKKNHHLHRARYRGIQKVKIQAYLTAISQNLKKMVKMLTKARPGPLQRTNAATA